MVLSGKVQKAEPLRATLSGQRGSSCRHLGFQCFACQTVMVSDGGPFPVTSCRLNCQDADACYGLQMGCWKRFWGRVCFPREGACFFQSIVHSTGCCTRALCRCHGSHPWHPRVRMPCGFSTVVYLDHPKSFRDVCWPEAVCRAWTSPAPHPSVRAPGMFLASTAEGGRLTSPAVQINIVSLDFVFWTTHVNSVAGLLLAITCLLFPHEVTHTPTVLWFKRKVYWWDMAYCHCLKLPQAHLGSRSCHFI